jgi:pantoate--beta-alanine ligase
MTLSPSKPSSHDTTARFVRAKDELRSVLAPLRAEGSSIGLVPTMGFLHEGHLSLLRVAREECDVVVMSLFVNPAQFGPSEDLDRYPRDEERDGRLAAEAGVDLVYAPPVAEVYPQGFETSVVVDGLTEVLDGDPAQRGPGHFRGVTTVVAKLFNTVQPDVAYFGEKDAQQLAVIRRMVRDLDIPVRVRGLPTVREGDGLAMSSRNAYLGPEDRERALALSRALRIAEGRAREESLQAGLDAARAELAAAGVEPEYLEARDPDDLSKAAELNGRPVLIAVAARVGGARLIDNVLVQP